MLTRYLLQAFYFQFEAVEDTFFEEFLQKLDYVKNALNLN